MPINKTKIFTMKNLLSFLLILPLFISCGGDDSSNHAKSEIVVSPELFLYEGAFFNAPKCEDVEGVEMNWLNPDTLFLGNIKVNSELFESIDTKRFFSDSAFVNSGDLLLILSNTFHSHNAYFIHVWEISRENGTFLNQRKTYKFNAEGSIIDESFMNHSFNSNSRSQFFLESLF